MDLTREMPAITMDQATGHARVLMTPGEIAMASQVAVDRIKLSRLDPNRTPTFDAGWEKALPYERDGVLAEHAVCKFLDCWPSGTMVIGKKLPRDDSGVEVKGTRHQKGGLPIQKNNRHGIPAVLGIVEEPFVRIVGWRWVELCREEKWWRPDWKQPAYCVPWEILWNVVSLLEWRQAEVYKRLNERIYLLGGPSA